MAATHTVHVTQDFSAPVEKVFAYLAEHENLNVLFAPARVERIADGEDGERNGVGSARKLSFWGALPFVETVVGFEPGKQIDYEITKGSPMRDHHGTLAFSSRADGGTHLDYTIRFGAAVPGLAGMVAMQLRRSVASGLRKADAAIGS
jgi:hypothetical protein